MRGLNYSPVFYGARSLFLAAFIGILKKLGIPKKVRLRLVKQSVVHWSLGREVIPANLQQVLFYIFQLGVAPFGGAILAVVWGELQHTRHISEAFEAIRMFQEYFLQRVVRSGVVA